jgi:hypothetical protein
MFIMGHETCFIYDSIELCFGYWPVWVSYLVMFISIVLVCCRLVVEMIRNISDILPVSHRCNVMVSVNDQKICKNMRQSGQIKNNRV